MHYSHFVTKHSLLPIFESFCTPTSFGISGNNCCINSSIKNLGLNLPSWINPYVVTPNTNISSSFFIWKDTEKIQIQKERAHWQVDSSLRIEATCTNKLCYLCLFDLSPLSLVSASTAAFPFVSLWLILPFVENFFPQVSVWLALLPFSESFLRLPS